MATSQPWHCVNPACQCKEPASASVSAEDSAPRCSCGALMKKSYTQPVFRYLDFLREEPPPAIYEPASRDSARK